MTDDEQAVRLVVLGDATGAPVCEGDVCQLPGSTESVTEVEPTVDEEPTTRAQPIRSTRKA